MNIDVVTIFPGMFAGVFAEGMIARAAAAGHCRLRVHDLRDWAEGRHKVTDDYAFGGGPGMVMKPEPFFAAVRDLAEPGGRTVLMSPQGRPLTQALAAALAAAPQLLLLCGRYEGVDERVRQALCDDEISVGDFVLTGGELPAMIVADAVVRLLPGVLAEGSAEGDSFATGLLEGPQYTRPRVFEGMAVPEVLVSGDHAGVARWRRQEALRRTWERRPDLLAGAPLSEQDRAWLKKLQAEGDRASL